MAGQKQDPEWLGRRLKLRDLRILMTVVDCGTMGKAAQRLAVSQPVVSKAISDLEHVVGVRLLDRSQRGVEPTAYGRALIKRGIAIFDEMEQGLKEIELISDPTAGEVSVAATGPVAGTIVVAAVDRLARQYPRMRFKLMVADAAPLFAQLEARKVEMVISRVAHRVPEAHGVEILFHDALTVVTGAKNPLTRRRSIALADLLGEPWVLFPEDSHFGSLQAEVFRASGLEPPPATAEVSASQLQMELMASNRFLTIVPGFSILLPFPRPGVVALPVKLRVARQPVGIVTLKHRSLSPAAQMFIAAVRELTKPLAKKA
jgi:DNA-binding transcriptional LysR family regulator